MSVTQLRPIFDTTAERPLSQALQNRHSVQTLASALMKNGLVAPKQMLPLLALHEPRQRHLADVLIARGSIGAEKLYAAMAQHWQVGHANFLLLPPDQRLLHRLPHVRALHQALLPWRKTGAVTVIATAYPDQFYLHRKDLETIYGPVAMAVAPRAAIETALLDHHGPRLAKGAETRVTALESCRHYHSTKLRRPAAAIAASLALFAAVQPAAALSLLLALALLALFSTNIMKVSALWAMRHQPADTVKPLLVAHLPTISIMVALYHESNIAARLAARLEKLDYPRNLLDVLLVVEADDHMTRAALASADLPGWMRIIVVPDGSVKTKPRALNYALDHCRGSIIGIYDAEDAPEPDQLRKVVTQFYQTSPKVVCLQGSLDFYNPRSNWLARCFTIEYAAWFRIYLPGIERLGLAVPLGGTTLFFRRAALERLGGWDAQNVTEDADLGLRLARHGYRTEILSSTTFEEANCRPLPWVKQRSRWIKGYMMTWITHMRDPRLLWRQLGPRRFIGMQVQFLGAVLQSLLAPLVWSLWLGTIGIPHPVTQALPLGMFVTLYTSLAAIGLLNTACDIAALRRTRHRLHWLWALTMPAYHPLATLAAYKALWELLTKPFYWDKTSHGHFDP